MKLLFFTGYFDSKLNANNKIAYILAENLAKQGVDVTICGATLTDDFTKDVNNNFRIVTFTGKDIVSKAKRKLELFIKSQNTSRAQAVKKFTLKSPFSAAAVAYSYTSAYKNRRFINQAQKYLEKLHMEQGFDMAFAFQMPAWTVECIMNAHMPKCKKAIYQLDPYGLHQLNSAKEAIEKVEIEKDFFESADLIFTTSLLYNEYLANDSYKTFKDKLVAMEFPTLQKISAKTMENAAIKLDKAKTNIVFCGILEDVYRNPKTFLQMFSQLVLQDSNLVVYFVGDIISETVTSYSEKHPNNIKVYSRVDNDTAFALLQNADFLLNIGNSLTNQLPSKIFEYFSQCKPIVHLCTDKNCSCLSYMIKYPLAFIIKHGHEGSAKELQLFLQHNKGKAISFEDVEKLFNENMPSTVCNNVIKAIASK